MIEKEFNNLRESKGIHRRGSSEDREGRNIITF